MSERPTLAERNERTWEVKNLLLTNRSRSQIIAYCVAKWNISEQQIAKYVARARAEIAEVNQQTFEENRARVLANLWDVFDSAKSIGDLTEQRQCLKTIGDFCGLNEQKVKITIDDVEMSNEELVQSLVDEPAVH